MPCEPWGASVDSMTLSIAISTHGLTTALRSATEAAVFKLEFLEDLGILALCVSAGGSSRCLE